MALHEPGSPFAERSWAASDAQLQSEGLNSLQLGTLIAIVCRGRKNMLGTVLLIIVVLLLIGSLPTWGYSGGWGYYPSGGLGLVLLIVVILLVMGRI